jgi:uncharacterized membrane protein YkvA (DUF1232 family)
LIERWRGAARRVRSESYALYLAYQDPRVPWYAKVFAALVVGYAFSPIDLIPDFIPVLGYLDDLILVPAGIALALRMIPPEVMESARSRAAEVMARGGPRSRVAAFIVVIVWLALAGIGALLVARLWGRFK